MCASAATNLHVLQLQLELPSFLLSLLLPGTHQLGEAVLLLWETLLPLILSVHLPNANHRAPRARRAQEGRRAVAAAAGVVAAAVSSVFTGVAAAGLAVPVAFLVVVQSAGPHQRRVAHTADDVLHAGPLGTEVLV